MVAWAPLAMLAAAGLTTAGSMSSAKKQMSFQERMSSSQYQRGMADMRAAGLNPILAYKQGGASSPQGAGFQTGDFGGAVSTALQAKRLDQELTRMKAETDTIDTQGALNTMKYQIERENLTTAKALAEQARIETDFYRSPAGRKAKQVELLKRAVNPFGKVGMK